MNDKLKNIEELVIDAVDTAWRLGDRGYKTLREMEDMRRRARNAEAKLLAAIKELVPKWTPVSEGLPDEGKPVLVTLKNGPILAVIEADWLGKFGWYFDEDAAEDKGIVGETVIAWQPLPAAYEGQA